MRALIVMQNIYKNLGILSCYRSEQHQQIQKKYIKGQQPIYWCNDDDHASHYKFLKRTSFKIEGNILCFQFLLFFEKG